MARTVQEIKDAMIVQKNAETDLAGLTSTSQSAIWNLIFFITAVAISIVENLFDAFEDEIEERRLEIPSGTLQWYAAESLVFQNGDELFYQDSYVEEDGTTVELKGNQLVYPQEDTDKQIVKLSSASLLNGVIIIKAAGIDGSGDAAKLEDIAVGSLAAFTSYWTDKRIAGAAITIRSNDPDLMKAYYNITYNPQILASDGSLITDATVFPVEDAIDEFLRDFSIENFDGVMLVMKLTTAIEAVSGVLNVVATDIQAKPDGGTYSDVLATSTQSYTANAGYMKIDPANPLSGTLTYIAG